MDESNMNVIEPDFRNGGSSCEEDDEERKDLIPPSWVLLKPGAGAGAGAGDEC